MLVELSNWPHDLRIFLLLREKCAKISVLSSKLVWSVKRLEGTVYESPFPFCEEMKKSRGETRSEGYLPKIFFFATVKAKTATEQSFYSCICQFQGNIHLKAYFETRNNWAYGLLHCSSLHSWISWVADVRVREYCSEFSRKCSRQKPDIESTFKFA